MEAEHSLAARSLPNRHQVAPPPPGHPSPPHGTPAQAPPGPGHRARAGPLPRFWGPWEHRPVSSSRSRVLGM